MTALSAIGIHLLMAVQAETSVTVTTGRWTVVWQDAPWKNGPTIVVSRHPTKEDLELLPQIRRQVQSMPAEKRNDAIANRIVPLTDSGSVYLTEETARALPMIARECQRIETKARTDAALKDFTQVLGSVSPLNTFAIRYQDGKFALVAAQSNSEKPLASDGTHLHTEWLSELLALTKDLPRMKVEQQKVGKKKY